MKRHAREIFQDCCGVEAVGLPALQVGGSEVFDGLGIDHSDFDECTGMQSQCEREGIDAGGFHADPGGLTAFGGPTDEFAMSNGVILEGCFREIPVLSTDATDQVNRIDIDANGIHLSASSCGFMLLPGVPTLRTDKQAL